MRWWRVFTGSKESTESEDQPESTERRRQSTRYGYAAQLSARCSTWPRFVDLFTGDVSEGGLYVPTDEKAELGEEIQLDLTLPNGATLALSGTVVNVITPEFAAKHGKRPGLGVKLDPLEGEAKVVFDKIVAAARNSQPRPELYSDGAPKAPSAPPMPRIPASKLSMTSVQSAISEQESKSAKHEVPKPPPVPPPPSKPPPSSAPAVHVPGGVIVGIDLGTSYTSIAAVRDRRVVILERDDGSKSTPSAISFGWDNSIIVGSEARRRAATDPARTVVSPKRLLARNYDDREIQGFIGQAAYETVAGPNNKVIIRIGQDQYTIEQLCGYILQDVKSLAEKQLGTNVEQAVISVPVTFDEERVEAVRRAGKIAQLDVVAVIDEPSAAALSNRFDPGFGGVVGVYDFGGGTFDFSVVDVSGGDFVVQATAGDTWLGGDDFDAVLAEAAANQFWREHKVDLRTLAVEWQRLLHACEQAKRHLSASDEAVISVPKIIRTAGGTVDLTIGINREILERASTPIIHRSLETCQDAFMFLDIEPGDLSAIYLSGGTTYIPCVRRQLAEHFGVPVRTGVPPEHAVCLGAAIHAAQLQFDVDATLDQR